VPDRWRYDICHVKPTTILTTRRGGAPLDFNTKTDGREREIYRRKRKATTDLDRAPVCGHGEETRHEARTRRIERRTRAGGA
jgi:hypothetical protein